MLWTMLFVYPFMASIQEVSARLGRVTGRGIAGNLRRVSPWLGAPLVAAIAIANTINIGADLVAMGAAAKLLVGGPAALHAVLLAVVSGGLQIVLPYERYARFLKYLTLVLFAYVAAVFGVEVDWMAALRGTLLPSLSFERDAMLALVAVLGTTLSPYLLVWQASQEAEEVRANPRAAPLRGKGRPAAARAFTRIRLDTYVGMAYSNLIAFFIILTCAVTLHANGETEVESASQAAEALRPIAGSLASVLFSLGILGTGMLAVPVLAGSAAYAVSGLLGWRSSLDHPPSKAIGFYGVVTIAVVGGVVLALGSIDPMRALYWAAVVNGAAAAPVMAGLMILASDRRVMGKLTLPPGLRAMGWAATAIMAAAALAALIASQRAP